MPAPPPASRPRAGMPAVFWWLWVVTLVVWSGRVVVPFLMVFLTLHRGWSIGAASLLLAAYGAGGLAAAVASGALADRIGRVPTLITTLVGAGVSTLALGLAPGRFVTVLALLACGACLNAITPAMNALVFDVLPRTARLRGFALSYWALNLGFAVAPLLAGLLAGRSFGSLFPVQAASLGVAAAMVGWQLRSRPDVGAAPSAPVAGGLGAVLRDRDYLGFLAANLLFQLVHVQSMSTLSVVMVGHGYSATQYGLLLSLNGGLLLLVQIPAGRVLERRSRPKALVVAALVTGAGFGATAWAGSWTAYAVTVVVWTLGEMINAPVTASMAADLAPAGSEGRYLGVFAATWSVALLAGPALGAAALAAGGGGHAVDVLRGDRPAGRLPARPVGRRPGSPADHRCATRRAAGARGRRRAFVTVSGRAQRG